MSRKTPQSQSPFRVWLLVLCLFALCSLTLAQIGNANLGGTVTDPSGAALVGAELTLTNAATGFKAKFTSDDRGEYTFRNLTPGTYELEVSKSGFEKYDQKNIGITINQSARVDVPLRVGSQTEVV